MKNMKTWHWIALSVVLIGGAGAAYYFLVYKKQQGGESKSKIPVKQDLDTPEVETTDKPDKMSIDEARSLVKSIADRVRKAKSTRMSSDAKAALVKELEGVTSTIENAGYAIIRTTEKGIDTLDVRVKKAA